MMVINCKVIFCFCFLHLFIYLRNTVYYVFVYNYIGSETGRRGESQSQTGALSQA